MGVGWTTLEHQLSFSVENELPSLSSVQDTMVPMLPNPVLSEQPRLQSQTLALPLTG